MVLFCFRENSKFEGISLIVEISHQETLMTNLVIYGTSACHLCEEASEIVRKVQSVHPFSLNEIDIIDDDQSYERYSLTIPVLSNASGTRILCWPFDEKQVHQFLVEIKDQNT